VTPRPTEMPRVGAVLESQDSSTMWRVQQPMKFLSRFGYQVEWVMGDDPAFLQLAAEVDMMILPRLMWKDPKREDVFFGLLRDFNCLAVFETDDDIWSMKPYFLSAMPKHQQELWPSTASRLRRSSKRCQGMTVTTAPLLAKALAGHIGDHPIEVIPNLIDMEWWDALLAVTDRQYEGLTIGWAGGRRNLKDLDVMFEAWGIIAKKYDHVTFLQAGSPLQEELAEHVPTDRFEYIPWAPLWEYPAVCKQFDIGCAPLTENLFNECKSPIKVMEYAAAGAAAVASETVYSFHFDEDDGGILLADTVEEWVEHLSDLIENEDFRLARAERLREEVYMKHSLQKRSHKWVDAWFRLYASMLRKRPVKIETAGALRH